MRTNAALAPDIHRGISGVVLYTAVFALEAALGAHAALGTGMTNAGDVLLTMSVVRQWEARTSEIEQELRSLTAELKELRKKLDAARVLMPSIVDDRATPSSAGEVISEPAETVATAILTAIDTLGGAPGVAAIRDEIKRANPELGRKVASNRTYLHAVIRRRIARGDLVKVGSGYARSGEQHM